VDSRKGEGTRFTITLPAADPADTSDQDRKSA